jgi:hypothetical protein
VTRARWGWTLLVVAAVACGSSDSPPKSTVNRDTLTQRQKDSILAQSRIPGASGVGKAMRVADSTSARVQASDTIQ